MAADQSSLLLLECRPSSFSGARGGAIMGKYSDSQIDAARGSVVLSALVAPVTALKRSGRNLVGLCPFHAERTPSFFVNDERGSYHCFGCGARGDAIEFVMQMQSLDFPGAMAWLGSRAPFDDGVRLVPRAVRPVDASLVAAIRAKEIAAGRAWGRVIPISGTPAQHYLHSRGILNLRSVSDIGFSPTEYCHVVRGERPALVAIMRNAASAPTALQYIFLEGDGSSVRDERGRRVKRTRGSMQSGAVRLADPLETLGLAGSVEDALSVMALFSLPCWAMVRNLIIYADNDAAGWSEANKAAEAHRDLAVTIIAPVGHKDWNDALQAESTDSQVTHREMVP